MAWGHGDANIMKSHSEYCLLCRPHYATPLQWDPLAGRRSAQNVCPVNPDHNRSGKRVGELHLLLSSNSRQDFLWTSHSDCLITDNVLRQFRSESFSGFQPRPVHVRWERPSAETLPKLWEIQVTGWGGLAPADSGVVRTERCAVCGWQTYTAFTNTEQLITKEQWDGSDFFIVWPMPRYIFITQRVASFIQAQGLIGAEIIELHQMRIPRGFGPGGLRDWMTDERAQEIGKPLDIY
jgi:hypothetical protein